MYVTFMRSYNIKYYLIKLFYIIILHLRCLHIFKLTLISSKIINSETDSLNLKFQKSEFYQCTVKLKMGVSMRVNSFGSYIVAETQVYFYIEFMLFILVA